RIVDETDGQISRLRESANIKSPEFETESTSLRNQLKSLSKEPLTAQKADAIDQQFGKVIEEAERAGVAADDAQLQALKAAQQSVKSNLTEALRGNEPAPPISRGEPVRPAAAAPVEQHPAGAHSVDAARAVETPGAVGRATANRMFDETEARITRLRESANIKSPEFETESTNLRTQLKSLSEEPLTAQKAEAIDQQFGKVITEAEGAGAAADGAQLQALKAAQRSVKSELTEALGGSEAAPAVRPAPSARAALTEPLEVRPADMRPVESARPVEPARPLEGTRPVEPVTANRIIDETDARISRLRETAEIKSPAFENESSNLRTQLKSLRREPLTAQKVEAVDQQFGKVIKEAERAGVAADDARLQALKGAQQSVKSDLAEALRSAEPVASAEPRGFARTDVRVDEPAPKVAPATADALAAKTRSTLESLRTESGIKSTALDAESAALTKQLESLRTEPVNLERALQVDRQFGKVIEEAKLAKATDAQLEPLNAARELTARELGATIGEAEPGAAVRPPQVQAAGTPHVRELRGEIENRAPSRPTPAQAEVRTQPQPIRTDDAPAPLQQARQRVVSAADDLRAAQSSDQLTAAARRQMQDLERQYTQAVADYNQQLRARMSAAGESTAPQLREQVQGARQQLAQDRLEKAAEAKLALPVPLRGLADDAIYATTSKAYGQALKQFTAGVDSYVQNALKAGEPVSPTLIDDAQKVVRSAQDAMIARQMARQTGYARFLPQSLNDLHLDHPTAATAIRRTFGIGTAFVLAATDLKTLDHWINQVYGITPGRPQAAPQREAAIVPAAAVGTAAADEARRAEDTRALAAAAATTNTTEVRERAAAPIIQASMPAGPALFRPVSETYLNRNTLSGALFVGMSMEEMRKRVQYTGVRPDGLIAGVPSITAAADSAVSVRALMPAYRSTAGADDLPRPINTKFDISQPTRISANALSGRSLNLSNPYTNPESRRFGGGLGGNKDPKSGVTQRLAYVSAAADRLGSATALEPDAEAADKYNPDQNTGTATSQSAATASLQIAAQEPPAGTTTASNGQEPEEEEQSNITLTSIT
ncbi:MAG TPA: hypothetical protein V6D22_24995, partial [Candidatus Obscuribacterales bacterium]